MTAALFHAPMACSLAARIAAAEGHLPLDLTYVNLKTKLMENGQSFFDINPLGQVSVLQTESGERITETAAVLSWIQSQALNREFRLNSDDPQYFQMLRWLGFCATELHKQIFRIVFYPEATDDVKQRIRALAPMRFELLDHHLSDRPFLLGDRFAAPDAYLTWFFTLADRAKVNPTTYTYLNAYRERVLDRPLIANLVAEDQAKWSEMYEPA